MTSSTLALYRRSSIYLALGVALSIAAPIHAQDASHVAASGPSAVDSSDGSASSQNAKTLAGMQVTANTAVSSIAPTQGSTIATQPQSIIGSTYIQENVPPTGDYTDVAAIAPSVYTVTPNGAGLMEAAVVSIRGFQD